MAAAALLGPLYSCIGCLLMPSVPRERAGKRRRRALATCLLPNTPPTRRRLSPSAAGKENGPAAEAVVLFGADEAHWGNGYGQYERWEAL